VQLTGLKNLVREADAIVAVGHCVETAAVLIEPPSPARHSAPAERLFGLLVGMAVAQAALAGEREVAAQRMQRFAFVELEADPTA
jgi:hypothetical protein